MTELDRYTKILNLIFTETVKKRDLFDDDFDIDKEIVKYENSISLYNLFDSINNMYLSFKKEYNDLYKFDFGESIEIRKFINSKIDDYRQLSMYINKPTIIDKDYTYLYLTEYHDKIESFITNDINIYNKEYYQYMIDLDRDKIKKYLDLFEKYKLLLYLYYHFNNGVVFSDGTHNLSTKIICNRGFLSDWEKIEIAISANYYLKSSNYINMLLRLKNSISVDECKIVVNDENIKIDADGCINILKSIFINEKYLNTYWDRVDHKEEVSIKSLNKKSYN